MKENTSNYLYKSLSLFSVVRGYNIIVLVIAQYLASIFIFSPNKSLRLVLLDFNLFCIILATVSVVAAGYIINNFYDEDKDKINRPVKSKIDNLVSQKTKLSVYFTFNFVGAFLGYLVSWKALLFFSGYIFLIWFYSHKLKKYPFIGIISVSIVTILPFFAVFVYFKNFSKVIFVHAIFLFLLLVIRQLVKNLENMDGDILTNSKTIPIQYGERLTKKVISLLSFLLIVPVYILWTYPEIGLMNFYFAFSIIALLIFVSILWKSNAKPQYIILHNLLKFLIFAGILSIILIDKSLIINKII